jgi:hypothetical protein
MQLTKMRMETIDRLGKLKIQQGTNQNESKLLNEDFLNLGDEVLNIGEDDCIIIDDNLLNDDNDNDCIIIENDDENHSNSSKLNSSIHKKDFTKATELLRIDNGVQMFYIANDGTVSTPSQPATLSVYSFSDEVQAKYRSKGNNVVGFVRVDSWMYPLVPNESPGMKTNFNAYIFPNQDPHLNFVGITFANKSNGDGISFFEDVLANYGSLIYQDRNDPSGLKRPNLQNSNASNAILPSSSLNVNDEAKQQEKIDDHQKSDVSTKPENNNSASSLTSDTLAQHVMTGAQYLSKGISATTDYANKYVNIGGEKIKGQLKPNEEPVKVDPKVQSLVRNVRYGTHVTVRVSSFVLNKLGSFAKYTAQTVAPHIKQGSTQLLAKTGIVGDKSNASSYVDGFCTVAGSSIQGVAMVYDSLEDAAKCLAKNLTNQTVTVVDHKYGTDAAKLTQNGMHSIGNVALTVNNFKNFKIVRTVAKETAKQVVTSKSKEAINEADAPIKTVKGSSSINGMYKK